MGGETHQERFFYIMIGHLAIAIGSTIAAIKCRGTVRKAIVLCMVIMLAINLLLVNFVLGSAYTSGQSLIKMVVVLLNLASIFLVTKCGWRDVVEDKTQCDNVNEGAFK